MELAFLALLCPIGMGLMMWFMAKGMSMGGDKGNPGPERNEQRSLDELRTEQERLASQIAELERDKATTPAP